VRNEADGADGQPAIVFIPARWWRPRLSFLKYRLRPKQQTTMFDGMKEWAKSQEIAGLIPPGEFSSIFAPATNSLIYFHLTCLCLCYRLKSFFAVANKTGGRKMPEVFTPNG